MNIRRGLDGWHGAVSWLTWGLRGIIRLSQVPFQLRRNGQPLGERPQTLEQLGPLLRGHREPDPQPSGGGDQIRPDQEDPISHGSQPPLKPARGQNRLANAHEQIVEDAAGPERGISRVERLETERVQAQILLEFLDPVLTVRAPRVHAGHHFGGIGDRGDDDPIGIARTLEQPPPTRIGAVRQRLAQTHEPPWLSVPGRQRGHPVGDRDAPRDGPPVGFRNPVNHDFAYQRGEPGHADDGKSRASKPCKKAVTKKPASARTRPIWCPVGSSVSACASTSRAPLAVPAWPARNVAHKSRRRSLNHATNG